MSKRSWLPPQKGTSPGPNMVRPTKLIIRGVDTGTPLYHAVAQKFGGHLKQFHGKQQQMYALSDNRIARGHIDWGTARATYTNIAGQETLELEVDARVFEELKNVGQQPWDWAVIDFHIPPPTHTYSDSSTETGYPLFIARTKVPKAPAATIIDAPEIGEAGNHSLDSWDSIVLQEDEYTHSAEQSAVLEWGLTTNRDVVGDVRESNEIIESLLVDLRPFSYLNEVIIEIFGGISGVSDDSTIVAGPQVSYWVYHLPPTPGELDDPITITQDTGLVPVGTPNPYTDYVDNSQIPTDFPTHGGVLDQSIPELEPGDFSSVWGELYIGGKFTVDEPQGISEEGEHDIYHSRWVFHENVRHFIYFPMHSWSTVQTPVNLSGAAQIRAAMFRGTPNWASSWNLASYIDYGLWEDASTYPNRFTTGVIAHDVAIPSRKEPLSPNNQYPNGVHGLKLLGQLHILVKLGSVTFTPA